MSTSFAYKLRLTAAALGCATRKDLCARFRAANPATVVDLERCHKWLQGVALPRHSSVYEDWAKVLGGEWSAAWLAAATPEAFALELCARLAADRADLEARAAQFGRPRRAAAAPTDPHAGAFVAYSWAMAPRFEGRLIRGLLTLEPGRGGRLAARYEEGFPSGALRFTGAATASGRSVYVDLVTADDPGGGRFFMALSSPGRPVDALCGQFVGVPIHDATPQPTASALALLRIDAAAAPRAAAPDCYLAAAPAALAVDLADLGFGAAEARTVAAAVLAVLGAPLPTLARMADSAVARLAHARELTRPEGAEPAA